MSPELDTRIQAVNVERGVVEAALAAQFPGLRALSSQPAWAAEPLSLRARPDGGAAQVTEALHGEALELLEELPGNWAWIRTLHDGYLGYAQLRDRKMLSGSAPVRPVTVQIPRTHLYSAPSVKAEPLSPLGCGATLSALDPAPGKHGEYLWWRVEFQGQEAFLHAAATQAPEPDLATFTASHLYAPYLWGGRTAWGLDCSGLAQLWAGRDRKGHSLLPRDTDQQRAATLRVETPQAGDLAFFEGHVGIMLGEHRMLHANATHLQVTTETLGEGGYGRKLQTGLLGFGRLKSGQLGGQG